MEKFDPPLMMFLPVRLTQENLARLNSQIQEFLRGKNIMILEEGIEIYQCVDGRWELVQRKV